jgi:hypothetical protein
MAVITRENEFGGMPFSFSFDSAAYTIKLLLKNRMHIELTPLRILLGPGLQMTEESEIIAYSELRLPISFAFSFLDRNNVPFVYDWDKLSEEYTIENNTFSIGFRYTNLLGEEKHFHYVGRLNTTYNFEPYTHSDGSTSRLEIDLKTLEAAVFMSEYWETPYEFEIEKLTASAFRQPSCTLTRDSQIRRVLVQFVNILPFSVFEWDTVNNECSVEIRNRTYTITLEGLKF